MSLLSFLSIKDVQDKFEQEFPLPKFNLKKEILAPPLTNHYSLVGTAFDYLLRFYVKYINPQAITYAWVAEYAPQIFISLRGRLAIISKGDKVKIDMKKSVSTLSKEDRKTFMKILAILISAKKNYSVFLENGKISDKLIKSTLQLAQLDIIFRVGYVDENLGMVDERDVEDLKNLISLVKPEDFKANKVCALNPTFGKGSKLVGGADADILLDDTLIDIKTTKKLELERRTFNQLIGYYILFLIGGINNCSTCEVKRLGVYFSRYRELYTFSVKDVVNENKLPDFIEWFKERARKEFHP
ncbi:MAG: hypothetical protein ACP5HX_09660 [Thermoproteota archaeon]